MKGLLIVAVATSTAIGGHTRANYQCDSTSAVCYELGSYPVFSAQFTVVSGRVYVVETSDLQIQGGSSIADTVLWVLRPTGTASGTVIGTNDDIVTPTNRASRVTFTASYSGAAIAVVSDFASDRYGTMDLTVKENGATIASFDNYRFGGFSRYNQTVRADDRLFVGMPPGGTFSGLLGNSLHYFSQSNLNCTSSCGTYQSGVWDVGTFSQMTSTSTSTTATLVVGAASLSPFTASADVRFFHSRLGSAWPTATRSDPDCDGLSRELETVSNIDPKLDVGTCDTTTGPSPDCISTSVRKYSSISGWNPADTDNDGFRDDAELYGKRVRCQKSPVLPYNDTGLCQDATYASPAAGCPALPTGVYTVTNALSALGTRPREPNVFVEVVGSTLATLTAPQLESVRRIFEEEGLQCRHRTTATGCAADLANYNFIDVQIDQSPVFQEDLDGLMVQAGWWPMLSYFDANMAFSRKSVFTHRYVWHNWFGGGQFPVGRIGISRGNQIDAFPGNTYASDSYPFWALAHEMGHGLGLDGDTSFPQPNYVSIMNYRTNTISPIKQNSVSAGDIWPDSWLAACSNDSQCPDAYCDLAIGRCEVKCMWESDHFSRGLNPTLSELSQAETNQLAAVAGPRRCLGGTGAAPVCTTVPGQCTIDYNRNAIIAPSSNDFNEDTFFNNPAVADRDDWTEMRTDMRAGLNPSDVAQRFRQRFLAFGSDFDNKPPRQLSAFSLGVTAGTNVTVGFGPTLFDGAYSFPATCGGACTTDSVTVGDAPAIDAISKTIDGVAPLGFRFDTFMRLSDFATGTGHQIIKSAAFQIYVTNSTQRLSFVVARSPSTSGPALTSQMLSASTWYWVAATYNRSSGHQRLCIVPYGASDWNYTSGRCDWQTVTPTAEVDVAGLDIGRDSLSTSWRLKGMLDEVRLWNFPGVAEPFTYVLGFPVDGCVWSPDFDPLLKVSLANYFPSAPPNNCGE